MLHSPTTSTTTCRFSSSSSPTTPSSSGHGTLILTSTDQEEPPPSSSSSSVAVTVGDGFSTATDCDAGEVTDRDRSTQQQEEEEELSLLAILVTLLRKSLVACTPDTSCSMEIGFPTNVRHVAHVTFDRFNGFLGLPVEFEPEVPTRPPSARLVPTLLIMDMFGCTV